MKKLYLIVALVILSFQLSALPVSPPSSIDEISAQEQFYQEHGYLWIKGFFSPEQVRLIEHWAEEMHDTAMSVITLANRLGISTYEIPGTVIVVPEAGNPFQACRTEDMLSFYPDLHHFVEGTITAYLGQLFGEPYVLFKDKLNFKWPGGGAFDPHQDFPAFELFGPREHVTAMVCIDAADEENGCLYVDPNWRKTFAGDPTIDATELAQGCAVLPYIVGGSKHGSIKPEYHERIDWMPLHVAPGDLVIFNSFVPHYSEVNRSAHPRRAMFFTLNRLSEGDFRRTYYHAKRHDPEHPAFHFGTPTHARSK